MRNIKLTIQYDGTNYSGWQSQKNSLAIQDIVEASLKKLTGQRHRLIGAARTDAGVHAKGQVANFKTESRLPLTNIRDGLNHNLPPDIVIENARHVTLDFHSRYDAKSKYYRYSVYTQKPVSPFYKNFVAPVPRKLDLRAIKRESKVLLGRHDFSSFQGSNSKRLNPVRNIYRLELKRSGLFLHFDIEADGFLYTMVRTIIGTLIGVGRGRLKEGSVKKILRERKRSLAGPTAPARGLSLIKVRY